MPLKELPTRSCCDDFCTACCCAVMCAPIALLSIPFHLVANFFCTITAPFEETCRVCGATRYEIDSGAELFRHSRDNMYYSRDTYHTLSETCRSDGCGFMMAPFANTFFACHGMQKTLREKIRGEYSLDPNEKIAKALERMRAGYTSIQNN